MSDPSAVLPRRRFLKTAAQTGALLTVPQFIPGRALGKEGVPSPSNRLVMGGIGIGNRGRTDLGCFLKEPECQVVAVCDAQADRRERVKQMIDEAYGNQDCRILRDMHELLAREDIDAVLITTGDRWHTMASITAAKAGKDIYCEKPCSMTIAESRALADTIRRYGRVYQAGTQRRSFDNFTFAVELARTGKLGKLHTVHANTLDPAITHEWLPAEPEPAKDVCDWDMWLGPCPWRPFNSRYISGGWRKHFDFHGGGILEWGSHTVDLCQWAANADHTAPVEYEPSGKHVLAKYASGVKLVMRDTDWLPLGTCRVRFEGDEGWVETGDSGLMELSPNLRSLHRLFNDKGTVPTNHVRNFLDCVKSRGIPRASADCAGQSHIACHAAYISWQLGRKLKFDPVKEEFIGDEEANRMRTRALREPWRF